MYQFKCFNYYYCRLYDGCDEVHASCQEWLDIAIAINNRSSFKSLTGLLTVSFGKSGYGFAFEDHDSGRYTEFIISHDEAKDLAKTIILDVAEELELFGSYDPIAIGA